MGPCAAPKGVGGGGIGLWPAAAGAAGKNFKDAAGWDMLKLLHQYNLAHHSLYLPPAEITILTDAGINLID